MKIHNDFQQNSDAWFEARAGVITASEIDALVTPTFKVSEGKGIKTYLAQKVAEWWLQAPLEKFDAFAMEQGRILEEEAKPFYKLETGEDITSIGFITSDDGTIGCSPDAILEGRHGVEIKCPMAKTHTAYLLAGVVPPEYQPQIQFSLFVTGYASWRFMSYRRKFPPLILTVERDPKAQAAIAAALAGFLPLFETAKARLLELNGGVRPAPPKATSGERPKFTWETDNSEITP